MLPALRVISWMLLKERKIVIIPPSYLAQKDEGIGGRDWAGEGARRFPTSGDKSYVHFSKR